MAPRRRLLSCVALFLLCHVSALPARLLLLPQGVAKKGGRTVLEAPSFAILSLNRMCQYTFQRWWQVFRDARARTQRDMEKNPEDYVDSPIPFNYVDYGEDDPPVEAIWGVARDADLLPGYRNELYSCDGWCQDIRPGSEWVGSTLVDDIRPQKRARQGIALPCPKYYKAVPEKRRSRRRYGTPAEEAQAIKTLKAFNVLPFIQDNDPEIVGDTSAEVTDCRCIPMTQSDRDIYEHDLSRLKDRRGKEREYKKSATARKRTSHLEAASEAASDRDRYQRPRAEVGQGHQATTNAGPTIRPAPNDNDNRRATDDVYRPTLDNNDMHCYDYAYPYRPEIATAMEGVPTTLPEQGPLSPNTMVFLQGSLSMFSGHTASGLNGAGSSDTKGRPGGRRL